MSHCIFLMFRVYCEVIFINEVVLLKSHSILIILSFHFHFLFYLYILYSDYIYIIYRLYIDYEYLYSAYLFINIFFFYKKGILLDLQHFKNPF